MKEKIYCGSGKRKTFDWGSIVEETLDLDVLIEAFNAHGYVSKQGKRMIKTTISQRKEEGNYGETHYSTINTWHPMEYNVPEQIQIVGGAAPVEEKKLPGHGEIGDDSEIPF